MYVLEAPAIASICGLLKDGTHYSPCIQLPGNVHSLFLTYTLSAIVILSSKRAELRTFLSLGSGTEGAYAMYNECMTPGPVLALRKAPGSQSKQT